MARGSNVSLQVLHKLDGRRLCHCLRKWGTRENEDRGRWLYNVYWSVKISVAWSTASDSSRMKTLIKKLEVREEKMDHAERNQIRTQI